VEAHALPATRMSHPQTRAINTVTHSFCNRLFSSSCLSWRLFVCLSLSFPGVLLCPGASLSAPRPHSFESFLSPFPSLSFCFSSPTGGIRRTGTDPGQTDRQNLNDIWFTIIQFNTHSHSTNLRSSKRRKAHARQTQGHAHAQRLLFSLHTPTPPKYYHATTATTTSCEIGENCTRART